NQNIFIINALNKLYFSQLTNSKQIVLIYIRTVYSIEKERFHNQNSVFYDIKFAFLCGNVFVATI
ncbi:MAG: hypothetical protein KBF13_00940, partial [Prevotella sp.]|nr:hypothetical protein [Prevotella sp.]